jgi:hypothetical protein
VIDVVIQLKRNAAGARVVSEIAMVPDLLAVRGR